MPGAHLNSIRERMADVQRARHVGRRDHHGEHVSFAVAARFEEAWQPTLAIVHHRTPTLLFPPGVPVPLDVTLHRKQNQLPTQHGAHFALASKRRPLAWSHPWPAT